MTEKIVSLRNGLKALENDKKEIKDTDNEDDHWNDIYQDLVNKANDLDQYFSDDYSTLEDDLENADGDMEDAIDMQDFFLDELDEADDTTADTFTARLPYIEGLSKIKYEDVLYIADFDDPSVVREASKDDMMDITDSMINDVQNLIVKDQSNNSKSAE